MNETKHTPLRLEQHGCAIYTADCWHDGINHGGSLFASTDFGDDDDQHYALCRAQRIVQACNTIDAITAQRDALLEACRMLVNNLETLKACGAHEHYGLPNSPLSLEKGRQAIALCERGDK